MVIALVGLLAAAALSAGAYVAIRSLHPPHSEENWTVWMNATGPWRLGLPFPVSSPGTSFADWLRNLTVTGDASAQPRDTLRGPVLEVEGTGSAVLHSSAVQVPMIGNLCCAEGFIDATWTTSVNISGPAPVRLSLWAPLGPVDVAIVYSADSDYCWRDAEFRGPVPGDGWTELAGTDSISCT